MNYNPDNPTITYTSPTGRVLTFGEGSIFKFGDTTLFDTLLTYDEDTGEPTNYRRDARPASLTAYVDALTKEEGKLARATLEQVLDAGAAVGKYGTIEHDGWRTRCLCTANNKSAWWFDDRFLEAELSLILPDGVWFKEHTWQFMPEVVDTTSNWLDFPFDFAFDFAPNRPPRRIDLDAAAPCPWRITIYGAATNPAIIIGDNQYQVNTTVPPGGILVADSREWTIEVIDMFGSRVDVFDKRIRGARGSSAYMWEPVAPGRSLVSWSETFGFDVTVYEERA